MEKMILANTEIEIQEGASIETITTKVADYTGLASLAGKLTKENLSKVKFSSSDIVSAEYKNMVLTEPNFRITQKSDGLEVAFGLRELSQEEEQQENVQMALTYLTDEQALTVKDLYEEYDPNGKNYKKGDRANKDGFLYKCLQDHVSQPGWEPGIAPSLWVALNSGEHKGTQEDPIPVPDTVTTAGFEYEYGKYYSENGEIYLCKRSGVENPEEMYGQKETLYYGPSALIDQYFEKVG